MLKHLFVFIILTTSAIAQIPVKILNAAENEKYNSWVTVVVPDNNVPAFGVFKPYGWLTIAGNKVGTKARTVHILYSKLDPYQEVIGTIEGIDAVSQNFVNPEPPKADSLFKLIITNNNQENIWIPDTFEVVDADPVRTVIHTYGRIDNTMFVVNMWLYVYSGSRTVPFELFIANCDQTTTEPVQGVDRIAIEFKNGIYPAVDYFYARGGMAPTIDNDKIILPLHGPTWFGHGQGAAWSGRMLFWEGSTLEEAMTLHADSKFPTVALALNWEGNWGVWGLRPDLHPKEMAREKGQIASKELYLEFLREIEKPGDLWRRWKYGTNDRPADTGAQQDFGVTKMSPALSPPEGNPLHLIELGPSVWREAGRKSYFYENDATPLDLNNHPNWVTWGCTTHWHANVSRDRLGKVAWAPDPHNTLYAKDWAHMSSNNLAGYAVLTGSHMARHLCRAEITCYGAFASLGEARGWGRATLATVWNYIATGDGRVPGFLNKLYNHPNLKSYYDSMATSKTVHPFDWRVKDDRQFSGKYPFWMPWQEGLLIQGFDSATTVVQNDKMNSILLELCENYIRHGWFYYDDLGWRTFWSLRYLDGDPIPSDRYKAKDPEYVNVGNGEISYAWAWASVIIARRRLAAAGVQDLVIKCDNILKNIVDARMSKDPPAWKPIRFDIESEWKCAK